MRTKHKVIYRIRFNGKQYEFVIPKGFIYDGCSIPRLLQPFTGTPFAPYGIRAGLLHDFLYRYNPGLLGQLFADTMFYEILIVDKAGRYRALKMYSGLRVGGWAAWNDWRKQNG